MAIGFDYADIYVAACGKPLSSYALGRDHERDCGHCQAILRGEEEEEEESPEAEFCDE